MTFSVIILKINMLITDQQKSSRSSYTTNNNHAANKDLTKVGNIYIWSMWKSCLTNFLCVLWHLMFWWMFWCKNLSSHVLNDSNYTESSTNIIVGVAVCWMTSSQRRHTFVSWTDIIIKMMDKCLYHFLHLVTSASWS